MNWFGESWGAPVCNPADKVETPVGQRCQWCLELFGSEDCGLVMLGGEAEHRECFLRAVIGSVAHQQGRCSCRVPGSLEGDAPELTRRQAAVQALEYWEGTQDRHRSKRPN